VAGSNTATTLSLRAESGSITDAADADITSTSASFTATGAGGAITLGDEGNNADSFGPLTFNSSGAVNISEDNAVVLSGANTANSLVLTAESGTITDASDADLTVTNNARFVTNAGGAGITLGDEANNADSFGSLTFNSSGVVNISEDNAVVLSGASTAGSLVLTAQTGTITDASDADLTVTNNASFTANQAGVGAITLGDEANNADSFGSLTFNSPGAVSITMTSGTTLAGVSTAGSLSLIAGGAIGETGTVTVTGTTSINTGSNAITLTTGTNDFVGAVSLTGGTTQITDGNALTLGTVSTGSLTIINTGALDLGTGTVNGDLSATSNGGNITQTGALLITGTSNLQAATGSIVLENTLNDFGGAVTAGATGGIRMFDINSLIAALPPSLGIDAGPAGTVVLTAGGFPGTGRVAGLFVTINSATDVTGPLTVDITPGGALLLTGLANTFSLSGPRQPTIKVTDEGLNVFFNGIGLSGILVDATLNAQSAVGVQVAQIAAEQLTDTFGTDSVAEQVDFGFAGDVGTTPPMDHRLEDTGISVPECFTESREGLPCKRIPDGK
jgi:fibronectin-binding autotransporter adhesin